MMDYDENKGCKWENVDIERERWSSRSGPVARREVIEKATVVGFNLIKRVSIPLVLWMLSDYGEKRGSFRRWQRASWGYRSASNKPYSRLYTETSLVNC
ncbi:hypothetical protein KQX54_010768 [Cotesia glomerata]|uniref:Uncharacterized protein n=1 Tax=Cotesia glomerata TaxID=32391 RepID=A0AAV7J6F4_COTGL|nr:hypothetical protein KQX54_010768 [Cotesia glomerata]